MLDAILDKLDESVFTADVKQGLYESFEDAVNAKAQLIVEQKIDELEDKSEEHIAYLNEKSEEHIDYLNKKSEEHIDFLDEHAEKYVQMKESELLEKVDLYLSRVVQEFAQEAHDKLDESLQQAETEVQREAFETMMHAAGESYQKSIFENADQAIRKDIQDIKDSYNEAINEIFELKRQNNELIKMGVIMEMSEGMTILEAGRFKRLAESIDFTQDQSYIDRLETIKESVKGFKEEPSHKGEERPEFLNENRIINNRKSDTEYGNLFDFSHLV